MLILTYENLAERLNEWHNGIPSVSRLELVNTLGRDLFQRSRIDPLMRSCVKYFMYGGECPQLEERWHVVLKVRLLFARDYFWSLHHHSPIIEQWEDERAEHLITLALIDHWHHYGFSWLVLHRAGLPISKACQHWELCESARWAALKYEENKSWGYVPGKLTQDEATWSLEDLRQLAKKLKRRVERGEYNPFPTEELHYTDVQEATHLESTVWLAEDLLRLMKDDDFKPRSIYRSSRLSKRFEFALVYMTIFNEKRLITKREAYATIGIICSVVWAKYGKAWLEAATKPGDALGVIEWASPYHLTLEELPHVNLLVDELECSVCLAYFNTSEPYSCLL